jgi:hypothetical protein
MPDPYEDLTPIEELMRRQALMRRNLRRAMPSIPDTAICDLINYWQVRGWFPTVIKPL